VKKTKPKAVRFTGCAGIGTAASPKQMIATMSKMRPGLIVTPHEGAAAEQLAGSVHEPHAVALRPVKANAVPEHVHCSPRSPQEQTRQMEAADHAAVAQAASSSWPTNPPLSIDPT
jgi:hypothetical protein